MDELTGESLAEVRAFRAGVRTVLDILRAPAEMRIPKARPAKPGTWKCVYYERPDLYNPDGSWRDGVDRMARSARP